MDKRIVILIVFAVLVSVVAIAYSSYYERIIVMQEHRMNVSGPAPINLAIGSPMLGSPSAPITIVEFGDYQCEMC